MALGTFLSNCCQWRETFPLKGQIIKTQLFFRVFSFPQAGLFHVGDHSSLSGAQETLGIPAINHPNTSLPPPTKTRKNVKRTIYCLKSEVRRDWILQELIISHLTHELATGMQARSAAPSDNMLTAAASLILYQPFHGGCPLVSRTAYSKTVSSKVVNMAKLLLCLVVSTLAGPLPEDQAVAETKWEKIEGQ